MSKHKDEFDEFVVTPNRILNKKCPYGYSFCYEKKPAKDKRYIQEWTCNWLYGAKIPIGLLCREMEKN